MRKEFVVPAIAAAVTLVVHFIVNAHYGFFRDELYFIICGRHPDWGYVDQPPLVPLLAAGTQIFGHSLFLLRAVPAIFAALGVFTTCLLVAEFGGGRFAQVFATIVFLGTAVLTSFGVKVGADEVGLWTWPLMALLILRIVKGANPRLWLVVGLTIGITLQSKYSVLFFIPALLIGLLLTPARRVLCSRFFVLGCIVALVIAVPNFLWQWHYGFPMIELLRAGQDGKNIIISPVMYLVQELLITTFFLAPVWIVGEVWLLRGARYRFLAYAYVLLIVEMIVFHGKHYYPANVYPILIAAGAVAIEGWTRRAVPARYALTAFALVIGVIFAPFAAPVLPEDTFVSYAAHVQEAMHLPKDALATEHNREHSALPGDWADMHGWPEMAAAVKGVYDGLPPTDRARAVVLADNYGGASAVAFFTPDVPVISTHNQYWLWGLGDHRGDVLVQIGGSCFKAEHLYRSRTVVTTFSSRWGIGYEQNVPIAICREPTRPLASEWDDAKDYN